VPLQPTLQRNCVQVGPPRRSAAPRPCRRRVVVQSVGLQLLLSRQQPALADVLHRGAEPRFWMLRVTLPAEPPVLNQCGSLRWEAVRRACIRIPLPSRLPHPANDGATRPSREMQLRETLGGRLPPEARR
jgi:hypothetical protein